MSSFAHRMQNDYTHRIEVLSFLRPRKKRQTIDDGLSEAEAKMGDDLERTARTAVKAKRKKKATKTTSSGSNDITNYFSSPNATKTRSELTDNRSEEGADPNVCAKCKLPKDDNHW